MAPDTDPYRTLGLAPGASADEVRRAYRRLAKANHPDAAGEKNLPRFLAIQAAYESLVASNGSRRPGTRPGARAGSQPAAPRPTPREAWRADPDRARTSRDGPTAGPPGAATGRRRRPAGEGTRRPAGGRKRPSNTATPGSTTYDVAEDEPFEPEWSGGTWYGASSGTYWTLNPKEYADPRKHGPEYQRRARRATRGGEAPPTTDEPEVGPTTRAWEGWSDEEPDEPTPASGAAANDGGAADESAADNSAASGFWGLLGVRGGFPARVGLALVGWPAIGIAITTIAGEVTGCGRFAAGCVEPFGVGTWLTQLIIIAILLVLPAVAALSAAGTLAALAASVPTAVVLSATGGSREPGASGAILGGVLAVAYLAGVVFVIVRRLGYGRVP